MDYSKIIAELINNAISALGGAERSPADLATLVEVPKDIKNGDYAFPSFTLAKELKKAPPLIAKDLLVEVRKLLPNNPSISSVEAAGPYLNFFVNKGELSATVVASILSGEFLARRPSQKERVMVEYSQQNTHKAFHVGHVRCAALGNSYIRLLEWSGYEVVAANYIGDEGSHVAKCLWYYRDIYKGDTPQTHRGEFLGELYAKATLLLDLSLLTRVPIPGVIAAKVLEHKPHPSVKEKWIITLETPSGPKTALTAGVGFNIGDKIPFATIGSCIKDRTVAAVEKLGVHSEGLVCSEEELGLSDQRLKVPVLPPETAVGTELAEIYRIPAALPDAKSVLCELKNREQAVSKVLQELEKKEPRITQLWQTTKQWSMDEFYRVYAWLDCRFDHYFFESEFGEESKELVRRFKEEGVFVESDGAIGADLKAFGLGFCILIKRDGTATYACRDLSLAERKFSKYKIDRSLYVVDAGQTLHFQQVFKCLELMGYQQAAKCKHLPYGIVMLPDGKMSSRKGNVILFSQLQERLLKKINAEFLDKYRGEWPDDEIVIAGNRIALATMRYGMLNQDNNSNIIFDLNAWTSKTGNTGPYMLYAYARICSILRELGKTDFANPDYTLLKHEHEVALVTHLAAYHRAVQQAVNSSSALAICTYVYELAKSFSRMYQQCSVLHAETTQLKVARAALVDACGRVIQHALGLLGIKTLERM